MSPGDEMRARHVPPLARGGYRGVTGSAQVGEEWFEVQACCDSALEMLRSCLCVPARRQGARHDRAATVKS